MLVATANALDRSNDFEAPVSPLYGNCLLPFFAAGVFDGNLGGGSSCCGPVINVPVTIIFIPS